MDDRIDTLASMLATAGGIVAAAAEAGDLRRPTPCAEFTVRDLLDHVASWVQVFDAAVHERRVDFDPQEFHLDGGWAAVFGSAAASIVDGLQVRGADRPMVMTKDPIPGAFVLNMLLIEYIGHGWDLARASDVEPAFTDAEATTARTAAEAIIQPQYRGAGMFDHEVAVPGDASELDRFVAYVGRDPNWAPPA